MIRNQLIATFFSFFLLPNFVLAGVVFSEIYYDAAGADLGHEWVEIENTGSDPIDVLSWRFFEAGVNHKLNLASASSLISPNGFAVIADDSEKFLIDWPAFTGVIFDSSFSLDNDGETLGIKNQDLEEVATLTYTKEQGANGDGNSLQKSGAIFISALPTPGITNASTPATSPPPPASSPDAGDQNAVKTSTSATSPQGAEPKIAIAVQIPKQLIAGADSEFNAETQGLKGYELKNERIVWNFGDGEVAEGSKVLRMYRYPGTYKVVVDVSSAEYSASATAVVDVHDAELEIVEYTSDYVKIKNVSGVEIDLSGWILARVEKSWRFPKNSFILAHGTVTYTYPGVALVPPGLFYPSGVAVPLLKPTATPAESRVVATVHSAPKEEIAPALKPLEIKQIKVNSVFVKQEVKGEVTDRQIGEQEISPPQTNFEDAIASIPLSGTDERENTGSLKFFAAGAGVLTLLGAVLAIFVARGEQGTEELLAEDFTIIERDVADLEKKNILGR